MVVVDGPESDGDVRLADVHDGVSSPRVAIGPAADGAAGDDVRLAHDAVPRLVRVPEAEQVVGLVAGQSREHAGRARGPQVLGLPVRRAVEEVDRSARRPSPASTRQLAKPGLVAPRSAGRRTIASRRCRSPRPRRSPTWPRSGRDPSRPPRPSCPAPSAPRGGAARRPPRSGAARVRPRRRRSRSHRHRCGPRRRSRPAARAGWHGCRRSPRFAWRRFSGLRPPRAIPRPGPVNRGTFGPRRRSCRPAPAPRARSRGRPPCAPPRAAPGPPSSPRHRGTGTR